LVISTKIEEDMLILGLLGDIDVEGREYLANELDDLLSKTKYKKCVIDFYGVNYIGSIGIGTILSIYRNFTAFGGKLCFIKVSSDIKKIFQITQLDTILPIFDDLESAKSYLN